MGRQRETKKQERARLIEEIIARDDIGYHADSAYVRNHRETLGQASLAHLREIVRIHDDKEKEPHAM